MVHVVLPTFHFTELTPTMHFSTCQYTGAIHRVHLEYTIVASADFQASNGAGLSASAALVVMKSVLSTTIVLLPVTLNMIRS